MKNKQIKWLIPLLVILIAALSALPLGGCKPEPGGKLYVLIIGAGLCGVKVYLDEDYQGTLEYAKKWLNCVLEFDPPTVGKHKLDFVIPGSTVAALAESKGVSLSLKKIPETTLSFEYELFDGAHYEISADRFTNLAQALSPTAQAREKQPRIIIMASKEPFSPPPVCCFYGKVTVNGELVTDGTIVTAFIEGKEVARTTTVDSKYDLYIAGDYEGEKVTFKVNGITAKETATWEAGGVVERDLTVHQEVTVRITTELKGPGEFLESCGSIPVGGYVDYKFQGKVNSKGFGDLMSVKSENPEVNNVEPSYVNLPIGAQVFSIRIGVGGWGYKDLDVSDAFGRDWVVPNQPNEIVDFPGRFIFHVAGDINMDRVVDVYDLVAVGSHFNQKSEGRYVIEEW